MKPYLCQDCGIQDGSKFYAGEKSRCKTCRSAYVMRRLRAAQGEAWVPGRQIHLTFMDTILKRQSMNGSGGQGGDGRPWKEVWQKLLLFQGLRKCNLCEGIFSTELFKVLSQPRMFMTRCRPCDQAKTRAWRKNSPEKRRDARQRERARLAQAGGSYTAQEWDDLVERTGRMCLCCRRTDVPLTVDHVIPLSRGGRNDINNLQPLCASCNCSKGTKIIDYR